MGRYFLLLSLISLAFSCENNEQELFHKFQKFVKKYDKKYPSINEFIARFNIFANNYHKGITMFSDLTSEEFAKSYLNLDYNALSTLIKHTSNSNSNAAPDSWDWRDHNGVSKPGDQGTCSASYAFCTIGNLEGFYSIHEKEVIPLSVQLIIDCDDNDGGCNGGMMDKAMDWIQKHGLMKEVDYPYEGRVGTCKADPSKYIPMKVLGFENICPGSTWTPCDEGVMKEFLYENAPFIIAMNGSPLQYYSDGIIDMDSKECPPNQINHAALIVGYGNEDGVDYWIVKNSWGAAWGENGFFRVARGKGTCGINMYAASAKVQF